MTSPKDLLRGEQLIIVTDRKHRTLVYSKAHYNSLTCYVKSRLQPQPQESGQ
jgi:hypothetical protein